MAPLVTVVTPVHNCMPYLDNALASVFHQSLGRDRIEMVAVDDGSTDGSADCLRRWADRWPQLRVVTEEASGGPSRPRNIGIEHATGEYLFFLDGDDCLGPQALERLVAMAERNHSDVVLAKLVGVQRKVPAYVFRQDVDDADLTSGIYFTLRPFKLVRRSMVVEHGLHFPEHMRISEDQLFAAGCYLAAKRISILGSYDCYYLVHRRDRSNTSYGSLDYGTILAQAAESVELVRAKTEPGPVRDHMVGRHLKIEVLRPFHKRFLARTEQEQRELVELAVPRIRDWDTGGALAQLPVEDRLLLAAIVDGDLERVREIVQWAVEGSRSRVVREGERWLLTGPGFRAPGTPFPDDLYEMRHPPALLTGVEEVNVEQGRVRILGHALLRDVESTDVTVSVLARHRGSGMVREAKLTGRPTPYLTVQEGYGVVDHLQAGFTAELDLQGARRGLWELFARAESGSYVQEQRLRPPSLMPSYPEELARPVARAGGLALTVGNDESARERPAVERWGRRLLSRW